MIDVVERVRAAVARHSQYARTGSRFTGPTTPEGIAEFESRTGLVMPPAFRHLQLHVPNVELYGQVTRSGSGLDPAQIMYLNGKVQAEYYDMAEFFFDPPHDPEALRNWLPQMVPFARVGGQSDLCLDFAFDRVDPPVIQIEGEHSGSPSYRRIWYVACDFLDYLELDVLEGDNELPHEKHRNLAPQVTRRMVEWYDHRDRFMGTPPDPGRWPEARPTWSDIDASS